jgi:hypothetical protein
MKQVKILGVHGLGDHRRTTWKEAWSSTIGSVFPGQDQVKLEFAFLTYDDIFEKVDLSVWETMRAVWKLARSGVSTAFGRQRDVLGDVSELVRWSAGYVVAWVENDRFKVATKARVLEALVREQPDLILAHSLGSLVTYDAFAHPKRSTEVAAALGRCRYVTLGSQIGNPFVVGCLAGGRPQPLPVKHWHHLYNRHDDIFTARIKLPVATNFSQVETPFDIEGFADHSATEYLRHPDTVEHVWAPVAEQKRNPFAFRAPPVRRRSAAVLKKEGRIPRRALLVGINDYPDEKDRLEGCVNDVFLMSAVLQESGFPPESIRVCLDKHATANGIKERLEWLLDDPRAGDERIFYYSGHGATIPAYGEDFEPDRKAECLVPWDFNWSLERAIVDDQIYDLYSQLPYNMRLAMILDCCHSGGMHRQGGRKVRGLTPPDDIRHRDLKWDRQAQMWVDRDFKRINRNFSSRPQKTAAFFGAEGTSTRIGRASLIRRESEAAYKRRKREAGTSAVGPYLPLIIEACGEREFSYEYRHGVTSYGAFTYAICQALRKYKRITFKRLVEATTATLADLEYEQQPQILGPKVILNATVPWHE